MYKLKTGIDMGFLFLLMLLKTTDNLENSYG